MGEFNGVSQYESISGFTGGFQEAECPAGINGGRVCYLMPAWFPLYFRAGSADVLGTRMHMASDLVAAAIKAGELQCMPEELDADNAFRVEAGGGCKAHRLSIDVTSTATTITAPITGAPVTQDQVTQAPVTQAPVTQAPVTESPVTQAPISMAPITTLPTTGAPVTSAPITVNPVASAPITGSPDTIATLTGNAASATRAPTTPGLLTLAPVILPEASPVEAPVSAPGLPCRDIGAGLSFSVAGVRDKMPSTPSNVNSGADNILYIRRAIRA